MEKLRWAVLGAAKIATAKVIPAMMRSERCEVLGIASRSFEKAREASSSLGLPKAWGSYEEALADPEVDAIYNPLPNHLHAPWSIHAAQAGKHVLCEKPIAMNTAECRQMIAARDRTGVKMSDAFMVRNHPQWLRAREIAHSGEIGEPRLLFAEYSYHNEDPANIRNIAAYGGGGLMDIGCYPIQLSRFIFGAEPVQVTADIEFDPLTGVDTAASAVLRFPTARCVFTCSTRLAPAQTVQILGTKGRITFEVPFNAPPDRPCHITVDPCQDLHATDARVEEFPICDQYTLQADAFAAAVAGERDVPTPLEDALANMTVIEAIFAAARK